MNYPKYYLTYSVMDTDAGANPFGHSFLLFSQQKSEHSPVEVIDSVGFYSQPSTTTDPFIKGAKEVLGFDIDLQDGHGVLKREQMRHLNGKGLHGLTFSATEEQFYAVLQSYKEDMQEQAKVINELNAELTSQGKEANGYTRYLAEKEKAVIEGREPRLKPFHITMDLTWNGLDSSDSYTCKDRSLEFLTQHRIISAEIRDKIISSRAEQTFPAFSALYLPPLRLISIGEPEPYISKRTGKVYYNHDWGRNSLFWATPVHTVDNKLTLNTRDELEKNYRQLCDLLDRIRKVEHLLREKIRGLDKITDNPLHQRQLKNQLERVQQLAVVFNNSFENQIPALLSARLLYADLILSIAIGSINPDKLNYPFILRVYESLPGSEALLGLFAIVISAIATILLPPAGGTMLAMSSLFTARQLYGFYKEEVQYSKIRNEYSLLESQNLESTSAPIIGPAS